MREKKDSTFSANQSNLMKRSTVKNLVLCGMFLAIGFVLPFLTGQIPQIGKMLLPMHLPVFLCGLICGWKSGFLVGLILPIARSIIFRMPTFYPSAISMSIELAAYGAIIGLLYSCFSRRSVKVVLLCQIVAMVVGRLLWGSIQILLLGLGENGFTWAAFWTGAITSAFPGIILQLILIPSIMVMLDRTHLVPFQSHIDTRCKVTMNGMGHNQ